MSPGARVPARRAPVAAVDPRRRLIAVLVMSVLCCMAIGAKVTYVQAFSSDRLREVGESQLVREVTLPPERGSIFDREGRDLALSVHQSTIWANPRLVTDPMDAVAQLAPILGKPEAWVQERLTKDAGFVYLARKVDDGIAEQVRNLGLQGISFIEEPERFLPAGQLALPVLGKVGLDNTGLSGLELAYEKDLAGTPGSEVRELAEGGTIEIPGGRRSFDAPVPGDDLVLTIDRSLQYETERSLAKMITEANALGGMAIVMEAQTGEVLALANLVKGAGPDGAPGPAAQNMALTNVYEPGSVNKMITVSAALEEGLIRPTDRLTVPDRLAVGNHVFTDHDPHPTAPWSITEIVANSSNVGSIMIGQKLGKDRLDSYLRDFGFGTRTAIGFPGESAGIMLAPDEWYTTSMGTIPIGMGVAVTAMQMVAAYNTIATGGEYVAPKLVKATVDTQGRQQATPPSERRRVVSERTAEQMTAMLAEVVRVGTGTKAAIDGYTVAGKTGTARKPLTDARGYKPGAYVSSFAGFVPAEKPALTMLVALDEPTPIYGGLVAAPVFAEVARYGLRQLRVPPPAVEALAGVPKARPEAATATGDVATTTTSVPAPPSTTSTTAAG